MEFRLPQLSMGMSAAAVVSWLKSEGEIVEAGEDLVEIESDKAVLTLASPCAGRLAQIRAAVDEEVEVQAVLAVIEPLAP